MQSAHLDLATYCTHVPVAERVRVDLFTPRAFRLRMSRLNAAEHFPAKYEIPFAVGRLSNWPAVVFTREEVGDVVVITTGALQIRVSTFDFSFTVWSADGASRICPSGGLVRGIFRDGYTLFDSASAFDEQNLNDPNAHWFYDPATGRYCDTYLPPASENSEHRFDEIHDRFFVYGPDWATLFGEYNQLVGPQPVPERKAFGFHQTQHLSEHGTQGKLLALARELRERHIPCDTLIVDFEWGDAVFTPTGSIWGEGLEWNPGYREPAAPAEFLAQLREMHFDVMLIYHNVPKFANRAHQAWTMKEVPEELWWSKIEERLAEGVRGPWMDTRRNDITDSVVFGRLQQLAGEERRAQLLGAFEMFHQRSWDKYPVKRWPWDTLVGGRRYGIDWTCDCEYGWAELKWQVRAITNSHGALRGYDYISTDSMGYDWKIQARWQQFSDFTAISRAHHPKPWDGGIPDPSWAERIRYDDPAQQTVERLVIPADRQTAEDSIRRHRALRYRLLPYIYSHALLNHRGGLPICRPMLLAFPADPALNDDQWPNQYLFGSELLVAPVCADVARMPIRLPPGRWLDWWSGVFHAGSRTLDHDVADVGRLPLFLRAGGILVMQDPCEWIDSERAPDPLWLVVAAPVAGESGRFELLEDDGMSLRYQRGKVAVTVLTCSGDDAGITVVVGPTVGDYRGRPDQRTWGVELRGLAGEPQRVELDGMGLSRTAEAAAAGTWCWDAAQAVLIIRGRPADAAVGCAFHID